VDPIDLAPVALLAALLAVVFGAAAGAYLRDLVRHRRRAR
jgi:hypothetical protein